VSAVDVVGPQAHPKPDSAPAASCGGGAPLQRSLEESENFIESAHNVAFLLTAARRALTAMLKTLFDRFRNRPLDEDSDFPPDALPPERPLSSAAQAAHMLRAPTALMRLSAAQAQAVVGYMRPDVIAEGTVILKEGDTTGTDHMLLVIHGEVTVETVEADRAHARTMTVLGPGSLIGELALFDGGARSATCTATTQVHGAILTRQDLEDLTEQDPATAARLMTAIGHRLAERLRHSDEKNKLFRQLVYTMQQEMNGLK
jgi:CRP-like cAMP-binding protein